MTTLMVFVFKLARYIGLNAFGSYILEQIIDFLPTLVKEGFICLCSKIFEQRSSVAFQYTLKKLSLYGIDQCLRSLLTKILCVLC
jgi:hypothetical protein